MSSFENARKDKLRIIHKYSRTLSSTSKFGAARSSEFNKLQARLPTAFYCAPALAFKHNGWEQKRMYEIGGYSAIPSLVLHSRMNGATIGGSCLNAAPHSLSRNAFSLMRSFIWRLRTAFRFAELLLSKDI